MMQRKRVGLVGYFGWGNFGDELFLKTHKQYLSERYDLSVVHDLLQTPYFSTNIEDVVNGYDAFVIGGGDLVNPLRVSPLYWQRAYLNKPTFVFGIGVPLARFDRENVLSEYRAFFQHPNCKLVVPRDVESKKWLADNLQPVGRMEWYPDPVCAMKLPTSQPPDKKTLGVVMRSHRSMASDLSHVRDLIDYAKSLDYAVKHLVLGTESVGDADFELAQKLARQDEEIVHAGSLDELCVAISGCSVLATIKFHGMVVATMYGIPAVAMSVTPKNRNFLRQIERDELLGGYTQPNIWRKISYHPARIHSLVRSKLLQDAQRGYAVLMEELQRCLG